MKTEKSKNLVVIIGNGFDVAHGLKTKFSDFAKYYLDSVILEEILNFNDNSSLFTENFNKQLNFPGHNYIPDNGDLNKSQRLNNIYVLSINKNKNLLKPYLNNNKDLLIEIINNSFLAKLYNDEYTNWFSIEEAYYEELVENFFDNRMLYPVDFKDDPQKLLDLKKLNNDISNIKTVFKKYLVDNISPVINEDFCKSLFELTKKRKNITVINFNYTNTIHLYKNVFSFNCIHIHGNIDEEIIFGYGDDTDENYLKMKYSKEKEFLRFFKTFDYLKTNYYRKALNAISVFENYDVINIGHSIELTDKTILKTILDSKKCDNIEFLKRSDLKNEIEKKEKHFELHANLSRIFESEKDLREKVISFDRSINFPLLSSGDIEKIQERENELFLKKKRTTIKTVPRNH